MVILFRYLLIFYFVGLIVLITFKLGDLAKGRTGVLAIILFPLMLLTEKGRKNLLKGKSK